MGDNFELFSSDRSINYAKLTKWETFEKKPHGKNSIIYDKATKRNNDEAKQRNIVKIDLRIPIPEPRTGVFNPRPAQYIDCTPGTPSRITLSWPLYSSSRSSTISADPVTLYHTIGA